MHWLKLVLLTVYQDSCPVSKWVGANDDLRSAIVSVQPGEHVLILPGLYQIAQAIKVPSGVTITVSKFRTGTLLESVGGSSGAVFDLSGVSDSERHWLARRNRIEPIIGHLKSDGRMRRCFLKGIFGDALNLLLCACGQNLRKFLRWLYFAPKKEVLFWLKSVFDRLEHETGWECATS